MPKTACVLNLDVEHCTGTFQTGIAATEDTTHILKLLANPDFCRQLVYVDLTQTEINEEIGRNITPELPHCTKLHLTDAWFYVLANFIHLIPVKHLGIKFSADLTKYTERLTFLKYAASLQSLQLNIADDTNFKPLVLPEKLEKLEIKRENNRNSPNPADTLPLAPSLKSLTISSSQQHVFSFHEALKFAPNLERLMIQGSSIKSDLHALSLANLRSLTLTSCVISAAQLKLILENAPNLTALELKNVNIIGKLSSLDLPKLKHLKISNSDFNNTIKIVNANLELEHLEIDNTYFLESIFDTHLKPQAKLKHLGILGKPSSVVPKLIAPLLSPTLVSLDLTGVSEIKGEESTPNLPELKQIIIPEKLQLTKSAFLSFLLNAPKLREFDFTNLQILAAPEQETNLQLPKQTGLSRVDYTKDIAQQFSKKEIESILQADSNKFILTLDDLSLLPDINFEKLHELKINWGDTLDANFHKVLEAAAQYPFDFSCRCMFEPGGMASFHKKNGASVVRIEYEFDAQLYEKIIQTSSLPIDLAVTTNTSQPLPEEWRVPTGKTFLRLCLYGIILSLPQYQSFAEQLHPNQFSEGHFDLHLKAGVVRIDYNQGLLLITLISGDISEEELGGIITAIPAPITALNINNVKFPDNFTLSLPALREITLRNCSCTNSTLRNFTSLLGQDGELKISSTLAIRDELEGDYSLGKFSGTYVNTTKSPFLAKFLPACKSLKEIDLHGNNESLQLKEDIPSVEKLIMRECYGNQSNLLNHLPNVQKIEGHGICNWTSTPNFNNLNNLNQLILDYGSDQLFLDFIAHAPNLKKLEISDLVLTSPLNFPSLPYLNSAKFSRIVISLENLMALIAAAPHCEFDLSETEVHGEREEFEIFLATEPKIKGLPRIRPSVPITANEAEAGETIQPVQPRDPVFQPPMAPQQPSVDKQEKNSWSQSMLIDRLKAYCQLKHPELAPLFPEFDKGICQAVSKWYADTVATENEAAWTKKLDKLRDWSKRSCPREIEPLLKELLHYALKYQIRWPETQAIPVNNLPQILANPPRHPIYIANAWHRTCLLFKDNTWHFFDPNFQAGTAKQFKRQDIVKLVKQIYETQGHGLRVLSFHELPKATWSLETEHIDAFIADGGFYLLLAEKDTTKLQAINPNHLSKKALEGLFWLSNEDKPFWQQGLLNPPSREKTLDLLERAAVVLKAEFIAKIKKNLEALSEPEANELASILKKENTQFTALILNIMETIPAYAPVKPKKNIEQNLNDLEQNFKKDPLLHKIEEKIIAAEQAKQIQAEEARKPITPKPSEVSKKSVEAAQETQGVEAKKPVAQKLSKAQKTLENITDLDFFLSNAHKQKPKLPEHGRFKTWEAKNPAKISSLEQLDLSLFSHQQENVLLYLQSQVDLQNYIHHLQSSSLAQNRGLFIINNMDDLKCATHRIKLDKNGKGHIEKGSPLSQFLHEHENKAPIIVVNWSNFTPQELVQANTILDETRRADGTNVPLKAVVLGLQNINDPNLYSGSDFSSRQHHIMEMPAGLDIPAVSLPAVLTENDTFETITVDFYNESNWQAHLYGKWQLTENALQFSPSPLIAALEAQKPPTALKIVLKNAPWHLPDFRFALNTLVSQKRMDLYGRSFNIPAKVTIESASGYELEPLLSEETVQFKQGLAQDFDYVLNPGNFEHFFTNFEIKGDTLTTLPGFLEQHAGTKETPKSLHLYLTRALPLSSFARLLTAAKHQHCQLNITLAAGVALPEEVAKRVKITPLQEKSLIKNAHNPQVVISNDLALSKKILQKETSFNQVINLSELTKSDIFYAIEGKSNGTNLAFREKISSIWQALRQGESVLLTGKLTPEIADSLAPLFKENGGTYHNGQIETYQGKLVLLTDSAELLSFSPHKVEKHISLKERLDALASKQKERLLQHYAPQQLEAFSYSYLETLANETSLPADPAALRTPLYHLPEELPASLDVVFDLSEEKASQFEASRKEEVLAALKKQPVLFLSGKTGVGKSSFMNSLAAEKNISVHFENIETWAKAKDGLQILFIDEANLEHTDWSSFEDLYSLPKGIYHKGVYYPLSANHVVIFAGNPASYGGERSMPRLFVEHPNVVTFKNMTDAYLYQRVLKSLLNGVNEAEKAGKLFLKTYRKILTFNETAISARELLMMAQLLKAKTVPQDEYERAKHSAYQIALTVLNKEQHVPFQNWFNETFGSLSEEKIAFPKTVGHPGAREEDKFLLTSTHQPVYQSLFEMIKIRENKQKENLKDVPVGISGIVLEGEPGVGKSQLVKQVLLSEGYEEKHIKDSKPFNLADEKEEIEKNGASKQFYYLPASMSVSAKINVLNRAFHEGAVVIIDEFNTSVMLERLMNALLMGRDLQNRTALNPGFTLIGTQNPMSMAGRRQPSLALQRRLLQCNYPDYTTAEMVAVLQHRGLNEKEACHLVFDFLESRRYARSLNLNPEPSFRDLLKAGKETLLAQAKAVTIAVEAPVNQEDKASLEQGMLQDLQLPHTQEVLTSAHQAEDNLEPHKKLPVEEKITVASQDNQSIAPHKEVISEMGTPSHDTQLPMDKNPEKISVAPSANVNASNPENIKADKTSPYDPTLFKSATNQKLSSVKNYYKFGKDPRNHRYIVEVDHLPEKGDQLKGKILKNLRKALNLAIADSSSLQELDSEITRIKKDYEFELNTLKTAQDITTWLFGLRTDSFKAFEKMCKDAREIVIKNASSPKL